MTAKTCFVIGPIGDEGTSTRKRADQVLRHVIEPPLMDAGYDVVRADKISQPGSITIQLIDRLLDSELVVADLTDHNANVFYELGVRHATGKPVIHLIQEGQPIPFDVSDFRTIKFNHQDLDSVEAAYNELASQVAEVEKGTPVRTPVRVAVMVGQLNAADAKEEILKEILRVSQDTRRNVARLSEEAARGPRVRVSGTVVGPSRQPGVALSALARPIQAQDEEVEPEIPTAEPPSETET